MCRPLFAQELHRPARRDRQPDVGRRISESREIPRCDADHRELPVPQLEHRAERSRAAGELPLPEGVADHRHRRADRRDVLVFAKETPAGGRDAEKRKVARGHEQSVEIRRLVAAAERHAQGRNGRDLREARVLGADRREHRIVRRALPEPVLHRSRDECHDLVRRAHMRRRPKQQLVDDAEHRRVRADAERERQQHRDREPGRAPQLPHRVRHIVENRLQSMTHGSSATRFANGDDDSTRENRGERSQDLAREPGTRGAFAPTRDLARVLVAQLVD